MCVHVLALYGLHAKSAIPIAVPLFWRCCDVRSMLQMSHHLYNEHQCTLETRVCFNCKSVWGCQWVITECRWYDPKPLRPGPLVWEPAGLDAAAVTFGSPAQILSLLSVAPVIFCIQFIWICWKLTTKVIGFLLLTVRRCFPITVEFSVGTQEPPVWARNVNTVIVLRMWADRLSLIFRRHQGPRSWSSRMRSD